MVGEDRSNFDKMADDTFNDIDKHMESIRNGDNEVRQKMDNTYDEYFGYWDC